MSSTPASTAPAAATPAADPRPVWETHLNVESADQTQYHNYLNPQLADVFDHAPKLMLDVGCAAGLFGAFVKERHPGARVVGIELNRAAAATARERIDYVFEEKLEDIDLAQAGIAPGSIDTVVVADVLEHMYDPWRVMQGLKPHLAPNAQIIASIPNTRHLGLVLDLMDRGQWRYAERGLLDITHIRFFTLAQIHQFFTETGYKVDRVAHNLDPTLRQLYIDNQHKPSISIRFGRIVFEQLTPNELAELCTWQFFVRARPV
jgi:O-antigen biosynthesis protein